MRGTAKAKRPVLIIFREMLKIFLKPVCSFRNQLCIVVSETMTEDCQSHWLPILNLNVAQIEKIFWQWIVSSFHGHEGGIQIRWHFVQIVITVNFKSRPKPTLSNRMMTRLVSLILTFLQMAGGCGVHLCSGLGWLHLNRNITTGLNRLNASLKIALNGTTSL